MAKRRSRRRVSPSRSQAQVPFFPPSFALVEHHRLEEYKRATARVLANLELRDRIEQLRRYVKGFDGDRYNLRHIDQWTESKRQYALESSKRLRNLISSSHITVPVPRSRTKRKALRMFSNQDPREMKRFVIHTEVPEKTSVEFSERGNVRLRYRSGKRSFYKREFFLWRDFNRGKHPVTLQAQRKVLKRMLPTMPEGKYAFWTYTHGMTGKPQDKRFLSQVLTEWYHAYEDSQYAFRHEGFGKVLSGLVYLGTWRNMRQAEKKREKERRKYQTGVRIKAKVRRKKTKKIRRDIAGQMWKDYMMDVKRRRKRYQKSRKHK